MQLISQGAEAKIFLKDNIIIKERISKKYRVQELDEELRKFRTRREGKILERLQQQNFPSPKLISMCDKTMKIEMEFIKGELVKDSPNIKSFSKEMGRLVGLLHKNNIIHYDLTTSNMIVRDGKVNIIDFGLGFISEKDEDKAVDLHLLDRALYSKHPEIYEFCMNEVLIGYKETNPNNTVLERLKRVELRGRNKK
ncbi:MAG: KEOPS complex kinase/ATPase Bud32 [Nanoarchaeota archaeon]